MAKAFNDIKKSLDLFDFFTFGKYQKCRVDSIVEMDYNYISFLAKKGIRFDPKVLQLVEDKITAAYNENHEEETDNPPELFDDVPF